MDNVLDVICQHTRDGTVIPIRIRIMDEDGQFQTFTIKSYEDYSNKSELITLPNNIVVNAVKSAIPSRTLQANRNLQNWVYVT